MYQEKETSFVCDSPEDVEILKDALDDDSYKGVNVAFIGGDISAVVIDSFLESYGSDVTGTLEIDTDDSNLINLSEASCVTKLVVNGRTLTKIPA